MYIDVCRWTICGKHAAIVLCRVGEKKWLAHVRVPVSVWQWSWRLHIARRNKQMKGWERVMSWGMSSPCLVASLCRVVWLWCV